MTLSIMMSRRWFLPPKMPPKTSSTHSRTHADRAVTLALAGRPLVYDSQPLHLVVSPDPSRLLSTDGAEPDMLDAASQGPFFAPSETATNRTEELTDVAPATESAHGSTTHERGKQSPFHEGASGTDTAASSASDGYDDLSEFAHPSSSESSTALDKVKTKVNSETSGSYGRVFSDKAMTVIVNTDKMRFQLDPKTSLAFSHIKGGLLVKGWPVSADPEGRLFEYSSRGVASDPGKPIRITAVVPAGPGHPYGSIYLHSWDLGTEEQVPLMSTSASPDSECAVYDGDVNISSGQVVLSTEVRLTKRERMKIPIWREYQ
jgi:hypothetical protein